MKVIIVGGGLVGSLCGCYLGKRGHEVHIYDYRKDPRKEKQKTGRSINLALSTRGLEALAGVGLDGIVRECSVPMKGRMVHPIKGKRKSMPYDPVNKQNIYSIGRKILNEILIAEADKYNNVSLFFNHKITAVNIRQKKITVKRTDSEDAKMQEICGDLIIGADGAFSIVRREIMKQPMVNFSQSYIEHGYIELTIQAKNSQGMEPNHLHIWPRGQFMLIALPNSNMSWTLTLFMPLMKFDELVSKQAKIKFFKNNFPDALDYIGESELLRDFTKPSYLVSIKCSDFHIGNKVVIIGDAAHAIVPFYGQGMNAGFEDCRILDDLIHEENLSLEDALSKFTINRSKNADAISTLAMYNYVEMRDLVNRPSYLIRKILDNWLYRLFSHKWIPLYESVTFTNIPYVECLENRNRQNKVLKNVFYLSGLVLTGSFAYFSNKTFFRR